MARTIMVPSYRRILEASRPAQRTTCIFQDSCPKDEKLHLKLGLPPGARVLFFAGDAGDFAHELAKLGVRVHYTDISPKMTALVLQKFSAKPFERVSNADALKWPVEKGRYDWLVSFEPFLLREGALPITFLRAIAFAKGLKIISRGHPEDASSVWGFDHLFDFFRKEYGTAVDTKKFDLACARLQDGKEIPRKKARLPHTLLTLTSNPAAEKKAALDLKLIGVLQRINKTSVAELKKREEFNGVSAKEIEESLSRVHWLTRTLLFFDSNRTPIQEDLTRDVMVS